MNGRGGVGASPRRLALPREKAERGLYAVSVFYRRGDRSLDLQVVDLAAVDTVELPSSQS